MTTSTIPIESPHLEREILLYMERLAQRHAVVFGTPPTPKRTVATVAARYAADLQGKRDHLGPDNARNAAAEIMTHLVDDADLLSPDFWKTDLGRAVAWYVGYVTDMVPTPIAAAILGMTRQAVHDAKVRGALKAARAEGVTATGISRASLLPYLRAQYGVRE